MTPHGRIMNEALNFEKKKKNITPVFTWLHRRGSAYAQKNVSVDFKNFWRPFLRG